jgi:tetratricopeptide (TPR) repeat protein
MDNPARSSKAKAEEKKKTFYARFADFLRKYRIAVLALFGAAVLAVVCVAIVTVIKDSSVKASTARLEKLDADYEAYSSEQDAAKKDALEKTLLATADDIAKRGPRLYAAQKAMLYKAKIEGAKKDWAESEKDWLAIVSLVPESYLAPVALQGAAVAAEELGSVDRATADYKRLIDKYSADAIGIPHAYFALGRLEELQKDYAAALASYQKIVSSWPDDDWTKLATDRIIFLKSRGLAK